MIKFTNRYFSSKAQLSNLLSQVQQVLEQEAFIGGKYVENLETEIANYHGVEWCVSCGNGTDALELALSYYSHSSPKIVFCPSYTYVATAEAIVRSGNIPWFVDIDPATLVIDPCNLSKNIKAAEKEGHALLGVITVDVFGNPCGYDQLSNICKEKNLFLIADSAQSFGAKYRGASWANYVDACTFSFYPTKPLGGIGDGGAVITNSLELYEFIKSVSRHQARKNVNGVQIFGRNSRLDSINAQALSAKLAELDQEIVGRGELAARLSERLSNQVKIQSVEEKSISSWCNITLIFSETEARETAAKRMRDRGIETRSYYAKLTHEFDEFSPYPSDIDRLVHSKKAARLGLSIPAHGCLSDHEIETYFDALRPFIKT